MIAYQGQEGAYSHLACQHAFPHKETRPCETFHEAMAMAEQEKVELAMIPVENSTAGRVEEIYRLIPRMSLHIVGEHFEPVNHCLLACSSASMGTIRQVLSHPQALAQCHHNIERMKLKPVARLDTAGSANEVSQKADPELAAIASSLAAERYGLQILQSNIQDESGNTTRFIILSHNRTFPRFNPEKRYITSVLFRVRNIPAALYKALGGFATNGVNLVKLESYMPNGSLNSSQFHVDIEGHIEENTLKRALEELQFFADEVRLLGSYEAHPYRQSQTYCD